MPGPYARSPSTRKGIAASVPVLQTVSRCPTTRIGLRSPFVRASRWPPYPSRPGMRVRAVPVLPSAASAMSIRRLTAAASVVGVSSFDPGREFPQQIFARPQLRHRHRSSPGQAALMTDNGESQQPRRACFRATGHSWAAVDPHSSLTQNPGDGRDRHRDLSRLARPARGGARARRSRWAISTACISVTRACCTTCTRPGRTCRSRC